MIRLARWVAAIGLGFILVGIVLYPSPYDESLYRNFSKAFSQTGRPWLPEYPNGYFLLFHPYLVVLLQSTWISLGLDSLTTLRFLHLVLWVVPIFWLTWKLAKEFYGTAPAAFAIFFLSSCPFFLTEAITAEFDMPYTAMFLWGIFFTHRWHKTVERTGTVFNLDLCFLGAALSLAAWVKFQCALIGAASAFITLVFVIENAKRKELFWKMTGATVALGIAYVFSFGMWALWANGMSGGIYEAMQIVKQGLQGHGSRYQSVVASYNPLRYLLFSAIHISSPLFASSALGFWRGRNKYICVPILLVGGSLLASGIREVRYWDAALPFMCILTGALVPKEILSSFNNRTPRMLLGVILLIAVASGLLHGLPELHLAGFHAHMDQLFLAALVSAVLAWEIMKNSTITLGVLVVLMTASAGAGMRHFEWLTSGGQIAFSESERMHGDVGRICDGNRSQIIGVYRQSLVYGLQCPYLDLLFSRDRAWERREGVDTWVLPRKEDNQLYSWVRQNCVRDPVSDNYALHDIWKRK